MVTERRWYVLVAAAMVYVLGIGGVYFLSGDPYWVQTAALIATGLVVIWYTWESHQLRQEARRQTRLQLRPFVVFESSRGGFIVHNIGHGAALNVKVNDIVVDSEKNVVVRVPKAIPVLGPGERTEVPAESYVDGKGGGDFLLAHLDPEYAVLSITVTISYQDTSLYGYRVTQGVDPGESRISGFEEQG